jgi:hypothetical protein
MNPDLDKILITMPPIKVITNINDPDGIKSGKYDAIPNSNFFNSNNDNWNISMKFNLEKFNNTLQCIIGNMQNDGWGLWITPQRKLQWKIGNSSFYWQWNSRLWLVAWECRESTFVSKRSHW